MAWSRAAQNDLESCAREGMSASRAAQKMGTTRNAILGRAFRTGVKFNGERYRPPKKEGPGRVRRGCAPGRPKGAYYKPRAIILQCLAAYYSGISAPKAARAFGVSHASIYNVWSKDAALVAEARTIAARAMTEARALAAERRRALDAQTNAVRAEVARINEMTYRILTPRQVSILRRYVKLKSLTLTGDEFGVSRQRIEQVVRAAEKVGFINPMAREGMRARAERKAS